MCRVPNDFKKYLSNHSVPKGRLETDVHDMTSLILSILIDFTQDSPLYHFSNHFSNL